MHTYPSIVLESFIIALLKDEGIDINPVAAIDINRILMLSDLSGNNSFADLKYKIAPIICRNKEEQDIVYTLFDGLDKRFSQQEELPPLIPLKVKNTNLAQKGWKQNFEHYLRKHWVLCLCMLLILMVLLLVWWKKTPAPVAPVLNVYHTETVIHKPVDFTAVLSDSTQKQEYTVNWNFYDTTILDKWSVSRSFDSAANYSYEVYLHHNHKTIDTFRASLAVNCEPFPAVKIRETRPDQPYIAPFQGTAQNTGRQQYSKTQEVLQPKKRLIRVYYEPVFQNASPDSSKYTYSWYVNNSIRSDKKQFSYTKNTDEYNTIHLVVGSRNIHCSRDSLVADLKENPLVSASISPGPQPLSVKYAWNRQDLVRAFFYLLIIPGLLALLLYYWRSGKLFQGPGKKEKGWGKDEPHSIQFSSNDHMIANETGVRKLADILRKRQLSDTDILDIPQTIKAYIMSGGLPQLAFRAVSKPSEFLVFIDKEYETSHLTRLFSFLLDKLSKEQVNLVVYEYYKEPLFLSSPDRKHLNIPVEKVAALYPDSTLIIFGNSSHFSFPLKGRLKNWVHEKFKSFNNRIFITPYTSNDWDKKENLLIDAGFIMIPADLDAQANIDRFISRQLKSVAGLEIPSYPARFLNLNEVNELATYLKDPLLFQWVCSLAIYPYPDWNLTLSFGNAIEAYLKKQNKAVELVTYTNLLLISRIRWLHDGNWTDSLRIRMMERLENEIEAVARQALLKELSALSESIGSSSLVKREVDVYSQLNTFLLDAYYKKSISDGRKSDLKELLSGDQVDNAEKIYLINGQNTLLKSPLHKDRSVGPDEYFQSSERKSRRRFVMEALIGFLVLSAIAYFAATSGNRSFKWKELQTSSIEFAMLNRVEPVREIYAAIRIGDSLVNFRFLNDTNLVLKNLPITDTTEYGYYSVSNDPAKAGIEGTFRVNRMNDTLIITNPEYIPLLLVYNREFSAATADSLEQQLPADYAVTRMERSTTDTAFMVTYSDTAYGSRANQVTAIINRLFAKNISAEMRTPLNSNSFNSGITIVVPSLPVFLGSAQAANVNRTSMSEVKKLPNMPMLRKSAMKNKPEKDTLELIQKNIPPSVPRTGKRILWVDDYPGNNAALKRTFEGYGFTVINALSNSEAMAYLNNQLTEKRLFSMIISDLGRDKEGRDAGLVLFKMLQNLSRQGTSNLKTKLSTQITYRKVPFIFYTARDKDDLYIKQAERLKPDLITNNPKELEDAVRKMLRNKDLW